MINEIVKQEVIKMSFKINHDSINYEEIDESIKEQIRNIWKNTKLPKVCFTMIGVLAYDGPLEFPIENNLVVDIRPNKKSFSSYIYGDELFETNTDMTVETAKVAIETLEILEKIKK